MRRRAQTEGCIAGLRQKYPARPGRPLPCLRRGRCLHRPGNLAMPQDPRRRAKSPALHCGQEREAIRKRQPFAKPAGGPMQVAAPMQAAVAGRRAAGCRSQSRRPYALHCRAGVHARWGGLGRGDAVVLRKRRTARPGRSEANREGIGKVMCRTPQSADADSSPYRGAFRAAAPSKASPARGGGCAARRRRRGALPVSGKNILQGPAGPCPASVRDDACIVPETLRWREGPAAEKPSAVTPAGSKFRW